MKQNRDLIPALYPPLLTLLVLLTLGWVIYRVTQKSASLHRPPGPKRRWLVGNLLDYPTLYPWKTFNDWKAVYGTNIDTLAYAHLILHGSPGDVVYLEVLGKPMLILNSMDAVNDLLDKRGDIYSCRPTLTMGGELVGFDQVTSSEASVPGTLIPTIVLHLEHGFAAVWSDVAHAP